MSDVTPWNDVVACTIVSKNYLALARTLARSYREHHPGGRFLALLVDRVDGRFDPSREPFELVEIEALGIPDFARFAFRHTMRELNSAVKARFLRRLLDQEGARKVLYFDPDVLVLRELAPLAALLDRHAIVLTPHLTSPYEDTLSPTEAHILQRGAYNLGFIGVAAGETTDSFLRWWAARLDEQCEVAPRKGLYLDQKWVDLVPALYEDVAILRDPGFNVAYWNLHERVLQVDGDAWTVNGRPCYFFHFSGFDPWDPWRISTRQTRFSMAGVGSAAAALFQRYRDLVLAAGHEEARAWPYAYGAFSNGVRIPDLARRIYRALEDDAHRFGDPFDSERRPSFFDWLCGGVDGRAIWAGSMSRLWYEIYQQQPELQLRFPDVLGADRDAFRRWIVAHGALEHGIDQAFVPPDVVGLSPSEGPFQRRARFYLNATRRMPPLTKRWAKRTLERHPWVLRAARTVRDQMWPREPRPVLRPTRREPGTAATLWPGAHVGVNVVGYFNSEKGLGEAARATVRALRAAEVGVTLNNVFDFGSENKESTSWRFSGLNPHPVNLIHVNVDQITLFMESRDEAYFGGRVNVGFWFWELSTFPDEWRSRFRRLDEIWAATAFTQDAIARVSPVPVVRMPVAIAPKPESSLSRERSRFGLPDDAFVFLFVFDLHSQLERKNPLALIEAFRLAFGDRDDVVLVLKSSHSHDAATGPESIQVQQAAARAKNVTVIDRVLARDDLDLLLATADCYASLHRSEGFGLPIAESMSRGTPVIVTGYSGNMDFTTPANSFLVKYRLIELERDHGPYRKGSVWADPDREHAAELMRHVVEHPEAAREVGRCGRQHIERFHAPRRVGELMRDRLALLLDGKT